MRALALVAALLAPAWACAQTAMPTASEIRAAGGTAPKLVSSPESTGKETLFAQGMQGEIRITVTIGADGAVMETGIAASSRSPELDAFAASLIARSKFEPARTKAGEAVAVTATVPVHLWKDSLADGSLFSKSCGDFIVDADWHARAFPEAGPTKLRVWLLMTGAAVAMPGGISRAMPDYQKVYDACQAKPSRKFSDVYMKLSGK